MRLVLGLLILSVFSSAPAFATRYGRDERILTCTSAANATLPAGEKYQVHIAVGEALMITRLGNNTALLASYARHSTAYLFEGTDGDLIPGKGGYITEWQEAYSIAVSVSPGTYETALRLTDCKVEKVISAYDPMTPTELKLSKIAEAAEVGNGGADFTRIENLNMSEEKQDLIDYGKSWDQCKWQMVEGLPKILELIAQHTNDPQTVKNLTPLLTNPGFTNAIAYVSDDDISCSNTIIRMYTKDAHRLEIFYSLGD